MTFAKTRKKNKKLSFRKEIRNIMYIKDYEHSIRTYQNSSDKYIALNLVLPYRRSSHLQLILGFDLNLFVSTTT